MKFIKTLLVIIVALSAIAQVLCFLDVFDVPEKGRVAVGFPCYIGFLIFMGITHFENKKKEARE